MHTNIKYISGSERFIPEKADGTPKFSKPHSKERVAKEREREGGGGKFSVLQKWLRGDDKCHGEKRSSPGRYLFSCIIYSFDISLTFLSIYITL